VVAGYRLHKRGADLVGSLLLGLYTGDGELAMAGVIGAFPMERRRELFAELQPLRTTFEGHPWDWGAWQREAEAEGRVWRGVQQQPLEPRQGAVVCAVAARAGGRGPLRPPRGPPVPPHRPVPALAARQRPRSCTYDQLEETVSYDLADVLATPAT
jgi:ATP-dependent DNA ligase